MSTVEFLKVNAKAVVGFVAGLLINAIQAVVSGQAPWPSDLKEWGQYLGTSLLAGVAVWATGNQLTKPQIVKAAVEQGVTVVTESAINATQTVVKDAVKQATAALPQSITERVDVARAADQVADQAADILKGVASNFPGFPKEFL